MTQRYLEASKVFESQDRTLQVFINDAISYTCGKGYQILDLNMFKEVVQVFYALAQKEYQKILKKIESD